MTKHDRTLEKKRRDFCNGCNGTKEQGANRAPSYNLNNDKERNLQEQDTSTRKIGGGVVWYVQEDGAHKYRLEDLGAITQCYWGLEKEECHLHQLNEELELITNNNLQAALHDRFDLMGNRSHIRRSCGGTFSGHARKIGLLVFVIANTLLQALFDRFPILMSEVGSHEMASKLR